MDNVFCICFRTLLVLVILFFVTKLLGKKQVSQLSLFDYVVGITIGSIAADISLDLEKDLIAGIVSLLLYGIIAYRIISPTGVPTTVTAITADIIPEVILLSFILYFLPNYPHT